MLECAEEVQKLVGSSTGITFMPLPQDDPKQRKPDITKADRSWAGNPKSR